MKEYIDKQELMKLQTYKLCVSACNIEKYIKVEDVNELPAYTQADIESLAYNRGARAFAEKLKEKVKLNIIAQSFGMRDNDIYNMIYEVLREMGCYDE